MSGCLVGAACGTDGSSYGAPYSTTERLLRLPSVKAIPFCPEDFAFGTPREVPDIHGGDGFDVLDGRARVLSSSGLDWTDAMIEAAEAMLRVARDEEVRLALLLDISAACGSQVIYVGRRSEGIYQAGVGVCAALLIRNEIPVLSHRDLRTLGIVIAHVDRAVSLDGFDRDHHESDWFQATFST